jgi:Flp pilus assembly protein CpaB
LGRRKVMRVYYFSRKNTVIIALALILVLSLAGYINLHRGKAALAPAGQQPIFQGNSGQKKVAITVNVDWGENILNPCWSSSRKMMPGSRFS